MSKGKKEKRGSPLQLFFIDRDLLSLYREQFDDKVSIQKELCTLVNQYMFDRLASVKEKEGGNAN